MSRRLADNALPRLLALGVLCGALPATCAPADAVAPFDPSPLVRVGDDVKYGSYIVYKIGERTYQIKDPGTTTGKSGAFGVDMYLICGDTIALMIDLGNNYIDGYAKDLIAPRKNAAGELREVVYRLAGKRPLQIALTHAHPDHDGMTGAFINRDVTLWMSDKEDKTALQTQHGVDPSVYATFTPGKKAFDLGGGRVVETMLVRGHSDGGTVYIVKKDGIVFTGDVFGNGVGATQSTVEKLKGFAEDSRKLVDYISANFTPYERYALRVYVGHSWLNVYNGYFTPTADKVDMGYLDWRYLQNMASCANKILEGKWLVEGSGLRHVGNMPYVDFWPSAVGKAILVDGIGAEVIPIELAYEAAGLKMQK
jgi:glyoxylase-like metal-dependent hydrolase (beta-lactamase superfamily II)